MTETECQHSISYEFRQCVHCGKPSQVIIDALQQQLADVTADGACFSRSDGTGHWIKAGDTVCKCGAVSYPTEETQ